MKKYLFLVLILLAAGLSFASSLRHTPTTYYYKDDLTNTFRIYNGVWVCEPDNEVQCLGYDLDAGPVLLSTMPDDFFPYHTRAIDIDQYPGF